MFSIVMASLVFLFLLNIPVFVLLVDYITNTPKLKIKWFLNMAFWASLAVGTLTLAGAISGGVYIVCAALARVVG